MATLTKKSNGRRKYYTDDGILVPGVTTVLQILNKPALIGWANRLGLDGIDVNKFVDNLAEIGTCGHYLIECHLKGIEPDTSDYSKNVISKAENVFLKFLSWEKENSLEVIDSEISLVSNKHRYGGTIDLYCLLNGKRTLVDLKTSKAVYDEHFTQVSAYREMLIENGKQVDEVRVLQIGRDETEGFGDHVATKLDLHFKKFIAALEIYNINRLLKAKE